MIQVSDSTMKFGDYITIYDKSADRVDTYIVRSKVISKLYYDEAEIRQCNNFMKHKATVNGVPETIVSITTTVYDSAGSIVEGQYLNTVNNNIKIEVGCSMINYIKPIVLQFRFILNNQVWSVDYIDDAANVTEGQGTIYMKLKTELIEPAGDDLGNGIASNSGEYPIFTVPLEDKFTIESSTETKDVGLDKTFQIITTCKNNDTAIVNPTVTYTSEDSYVCSVSITGLVKE